MLVVRVEVWPYGQKDKAYEICSLRLVNTVDNEDPKKGNYDVHLRMSASSAIYKVGSLRDYDRSQHVLQLVGLGALLAIDWMKDKPVQP